MSIVRSLARAWLPPIITGSLRNWRNGVIRFEGNFSSWEEAAAVCTGYDAGHILAKVLAATLEVKRGGAVFERDSVLFDRIEYAWPVTAGLMWAAARNGGHLDVLDFGGALGSGYFQNQNLLGALRDVHWSIVEQPHYVQAGRAHIEDARLRFYDSIDLCLEANRPNVVLLSSVLQYLEYPYDVFEQLSRSGACCLIIDRTPFSSIGADRILVQRVPAQIYSASYPMWALSKTRFLDIAEKYWKLLAAYDSPEGTIWPGIGPEFTFQGMIFAAKQ